MGSQPWKRGRLDRWEDEFSGEVVTVRNPGTVYGRDDAPIRPKPKTVEGRFAGTGTWRGLPCIYVHTRPEMTDVRAEGYFSHEWAIVLQRDMIVEPKGETCKT